MSHYNSKQFDASVCRFADREDCARNACWFALAKNPVTERFHADSELYGSIEQVNERGQHGDVYGVFVMPLDEEGRGAFLSDDEARCDALFIGWFVCDGLLDKAWCNVQENPWVKSRLSVGKSKAPWHSSAVKI